MNGSHKEAGHEAKGAGREAAAGISFSARRESFFLVTTPGRVPLSRSFVGSGSETVNLGR